MGSHAEWNELFFAYLATRYRERDTRACREGLVQPMIDFLSAITPTDIVEGITSEEDLGHTVMRRNEAKAALVDWCRHCCRCELGRKL